jgi:hypothetical protein
MSNRLGKIAVVASLLVAGMIADFLSGAGLFTVNVEAVVGRPATPVSVAGVARRTTRRVVRRTTVYVATLPGGCTTVVIEGVTLQQCGSTYYQPYNNQYVVVVIE